MKLTSLLLFLVISATLFAQTPIEFTNPSFEDTPQAGKTPKGWYNCGLASESPPDVQPNNQFKVEIQPTDGKSYLGMVVRDNTTWEAVGQRLKTPLVAETTYAFGIHLARSPYYVSLSRATGEEVNYATTCVLVIWGGNSYCDRKELLYETQSIKHADWQLYNIAFTPKKDHNFLTFEIYYAASDTSNTLAYNGNLLLDNIISDVTKLKFNENQLAYRSPKSQLKQIAPHKLYKPKVGQLSDYRLRTHIENIKNISISESELVKFPTLRDDYESLKNILVFTNFLRANPEKQCFDKRPIEEIERLAKDFKKFNCYQTATKIDELIPHVKAISSVETKASRKNISSLKKSNETINKSLNKDDFYKKVNVYIQKNNAELNLLFKD